MAFFLPFSDTICAEESDPGELHGTVHLLEPFYTHNVDPGSPSPL